MLTTFTEKFLPIIKIVVMYVLKIYLHIFFVRQCQRRTICSPLSPVFRTVHQNSGFASDMAVRKKSVREKINKYSGETGGHGVTLVSSVASSVTFFANKFKQRISNSVQHKTMSFEVQTHALSRLDNPDP